jgi:hypothetical protein
MPSVTAPARPVLAVVAVLLLGAILAPGAAAAPAVVPCNAVKGFAIYANGVRCPTAKKLVRSISGRPFRAPKVTIRNVAGWLCVASYSRRTKKQVAGSCLRVGTVATGFGWTKGGAIVPLPPGVTAPPPPPASG